jgi:hypothetical protein
MWNSLGLWGPKLYFSAVNTKQVTSRLEGYHTAVSLEAAHFSANIAGFSTLNSEKNLVFFVDSPLRYVKLVKYVKSVKIGVVVESPQGVSSRFPPFG